MFNWYREITPVERKTFWTCFTGWALDALDVQMFGLASISLGARSRVEEAAGKIASA